jgi:hypothetical protein
MTTKPHDPKKISPHRVRRRRVALDSKIGLDMATEIAALLSFGTYRSEVTPTAIAKKYSAARASVEDAERVARAAIALPPDERIRCALEIFATLDRKLDAALKGARNPDMAKAIMIMTWAADLLGLTPSRATIKERADRTIAARK